MTKQTRAYRGSGDETLNSSLDLILLECSFKILSMQQASFGLLKCCFINAIAVIKLFVDGIDRSAHFKGVSLNTKSFLCQK